MNVYQIGDNSALCGRHDEHDFIIASEQSSITKYLLPSLPRVDLD